MNRINIGIAQRLAEARGKVADLRLQSAATRLRLLLEKYSPSQPRVPRGRLDGGQWTSGPSGTSLRNQPPTGRRQALQQQRPSARALSDKPKILLSGRFGDGDREACELQLEKDLFQCRMVPWNPFCESQAQSRFTACMKGDPIPDFFHVL